jgi:aldose 1-epimerase
MTQPDKKAHREIFGHLPDGTAIEAVWLSGDNGFEVRIITYGAALHSIFAPDRAGRIADVVLGRHDLAGYLAVRRFLGATVGRYANRIANGAFELDGACFQLPTNDGANALHGGLAGFDRKPWTITAIGENPAPFVTLSYVSADGEEGYPGQLKTDITYRISGGTELSVEFFAVTDKPTNPQPAPRYLPAVLDLAARMQPAPGTVTPVYVQHDDWCDLWWGGRCNCEPEVTTEPPAH